MWTSSFIPGFLWDNAPKNLKKLAEFENKTEYQNTFMQLLNLTIDEYVWGKLPETCDERFLEMMFLLNGMACMHNNPVEGLETLGFLPKMFTKYGQFATGSAFGFFGQARDCTCFIDGAPIEGVDTVVGRCNNLNYPLVNYIRVTARRLSDTARAMETIQRQMKSPFIIACEETQAPTVDKIFNKTQENQVYIVGSNMLQRDAFQVIDTKVQGENIRILQDYYDNTLNKFLRIIGIKGTGDSDKKERLVVAEATSEYSVTNDYIDQGLHTRKLFAEQCNKVFGTNISVEVNDSREYLVGNELYNMQDSEEQGDESNEIQ